MEKFDAIIVGAGPGGLKCAEILAKNGKSVLVLEKNETIGKKICAAGVTLKAMRYGIPEELFERTFNKFRFYNKDRYVEVEDEKPIVATLSREELGKWQMKEAKKGGAEVRMSSKVTSINEDSVVVGGENIKFTNLVGADGVGSAVRKHLNLRTEKMHLAMHYLVENDFDNLEIHFDPNISKASYAWIFPHKGYASVGCGFSQKMNDVVKVKERFQQWCGKWNIDCRDSKFESMPILYDYQGYNFGNKFLVGEAAGLAYGLTGEGIYSALASADDAANLILDNCYIPKYIPGILRKKSIQEKVVRVLESPFGNMAQSIGFWLMKGKKWQDRGIRLTLG
ncbi:MAG: NAD(P)/FAD-dependent oxidoreductase [Candidatus Woesearchaeota archaeon]